MHHLVSRLILFKDNDKQGILNGLSEIFRVFETDNYNTELLVSDIYIQVNRLLELSTAYGFDKNLWHNYLAYLLSMTENPLTLVSEKRGIPAGTVNYFVRNDLAVFKKLFDFDFSEIEGVLGISCFSSITAYTAAEKSETVYNRSVSEKVQKLSLGIEQANSEAELYEAVSGFYKTYGVGMFGLNKAFRLAENAEIIPITSMSEVVLEDLVGYESQKSELIQNTEAFVRGQRANNVLLYGDAGTGKSTSVKAVLNRYYHQGLRMIEVYKHQFKYLSRIIDRVKNRNYRFIIFMDDLSFEEFEVDYKYLKAVIEGGLEEKPGNVLIYATSNRRHLIRETWGDREDISDDELHRSDTMQEKLSLSHRFGLSIGYYQPSRQEFYDIVKVLAARHPEITMSQEELLAKANIWELHGGGLSGRTASQFVTSLLGQVNM